MAPEPDHNVDHPPTLFQAGILEGRAVRVDPSSIRPLGGRHGIFLATTNGASTPGDVRSVVVKSVVDDGSRQPRNAKREARLLAKLDHPNIVSLLNAYLYPPTSTSFAETVHIFTPCYPFTLRQLLDSPAFVPDEHSEAFPSLSHSIAAQLVSATSHLHANSISHRDINPSNVVVSATGRALLIDFGIAIERNDEKEGERHFEVGTGPYRAPELVFASRDYDVFGIDLWALAATVCELFRPFESRPSPSSLDSPDPFPDRSSFDFTPPDTSTSSPRRESLFTSGQSDFVLAASIFKIVGTPDSETWPEAELLPNFGRFSFVSFPPTRLESHLPFLDKTSPLLGVLQSMLTCSAAKRMTAATAKDYLGDFSAAEGDYSEYLASVIDGQSEGL